MNSRSLTCVYPETRPDVLSYRGNGVEGVGQRPDQVVIVSACVRGYTITHPVQKSGLFFTYNYGKFLTLQTATHKTHKTHNCHVLIDTPLPYRGIFSPVLIVFCRWLRQIGKERICGALSRIIFLITQTLMASPCNPGGFFNLSLCFVIHSEYRQYG